MNTIQKCKHGLMIFNRKDSIIGKSFDNYGEYSEKQIGLIKNFIKEDDVIYDIGANIGSFTILFARSVPKGFVFAFEPERHNFYSLCGNITINNISNVYCYQYAIGNISGSIFVPELDHEQIFNHNDINLNKKYDCNGYNSILTTIDSIKSNKCNLIKINNCGMEINALQGGLETINANKPYIFINNHNQDFSNEIIEFIKSLKYKIYFLKENLFNPSNFYQNKENIFLANKYNNLFCHPEELKIENELIKNFDLISI